MNRFFRCLSCLMCLVLITTGLPVFAENDPDVGSYDIITASEDQAADPTPSPAPTDEATPSPVPTDETTQSPAPTDETTPSSAPTDEATPSPVPTDEAPQSPAPTDETPQSPAPTDEATPSPVPTDEATPVSTPTPVPTPAPAVEFAADSAEYDMLALQGVDAAALTGLSVKDAADPAVIWTSSDTSVLTVENGLVTAHKPGSVTLTAALASDAAISDSLTVSVTLALTLSAPAVSEDDVVTLALTTKNGAAVPADRAVWTSSDTSVATVADGVLTCLFAGSATITAEYLGAKASVEVNVAARSVPFTASDVDMFSNQTGRIVITADSGEEIDYSRAVFTQTDPSAPVYFSVTADGTIVPVLEDGKIGCSNSFTYEVRVDYRGCTDTVKVTVRQAITGGYIHDGSMDPRYVKLFVGYTVNAAQYIQTGPYTNQDYPVSYVSSDTALFTIDEKTGSAAAKKSGTGEITVTMRSGFVLKIPVRCYVPAASLDIADIEEYMHVGTSRQLEYSVSPANADEELYWTSSDYNIADVDQSGKVKFKNAGYAEITVESRTTGAKASVGLIVIRPVTHIQLYKGVFDNKTSFTIGQGKTFLPVIDIQPTDATLNGYVLVTSDSSVVQFTSDGKIKGVGVGSAVVTIISADGEVSRDLRVNVVSKKKAVTSFRLNYSKVSIYEGKTKTVKARINSGATDKSVVWASSNETVATVDQKGRITGVSPGTCNIWAISSTGVYKSVKVTVKMQKPTKVRLNVSRGSIYPGQEYQFKATISPSNVVQPEMLKLTWKSSNTKVAIVTDDGHLYAIAPGTAKITVTTANGKKHTCRVTVKKRKATSVKIVNEYTQFIVGGTYDLDAIVSPDDVHDDSVRWSSSSSSRAKIDKNTGVLTCRKAGTVKITARAKDGSGKKHTITIKIVNVPLNYGSVKINGGEVAANSTYKLEYKATLNIDVSTDPVMEITYSSSDERVATVKDGVITATGCGKAKITVTAGGRYKRSFYVNVPYAADAPRYRALVISQYTKSSATGYLPFIVNSTSGIVDALELSDLEGSRYDVTYKKEFTNSTQVINSIKSTFADTKEGDVSVVYIITHGTLNNGSFRWHLKGSGRKSVYLYPQDVMNALKGIKGDVVLVVLSCYSGGDVENTGNLTNMIRTLDDNSSAGTSYSVICASDGTKRASYANTAASFSYDFFTYGLCQSLGWDMRTSTEAATSADANGDGQISLKELAQSTKVITKEECAAFLDKYGSSAYWGPAQKTQDVSYYLSPDAGDVTVFGK